MRTRYHMKTLAFHTVVPARLFLFAAAVTGPATTLLAEASRVDVETLHQMKVEDVPEEVILDVPPAVACFTQLA